MASIDQKVVSMSFDNSKFQSAANATLGMLKKLESALSFGKGKGGASGLKAIGEAAKGINLGDIATKIDGLASKFGGLKAIGTGALLAIGNGAVGLAQKLGANLMSSVTSGFGEYETKIGSIQTILANTRKYGTELPEVAKNLDALNTYADKTIYSFGDMTRNIGLFTNAGIRVGDATSLIKGFSNEAAASGTNSAAATNAAYQLTQAMSAGVIKLMDWRSLTNAGMGNKNMQAGLIDIASAMGVLNKQTKTSAMNDFGKSLEKGWLKADVMSNYLKIMSGDMSDAEMKTLKLTDAQIKNFREQQVMAEKAATMVRTATQLFGTIAEATGSGWAKSFEILFGDFNEATELFTGINNFVGPMIDAMSDSRNKMFQDFVDGGGRADIIQAFSNIGTAIKDIFVPISEGFKSIFPPQTASTLLGFAKGFKDLTSNMKVTAPMAAAIKGAFSGLAVVLATAGHVAGFFLDTLVQYGRVGSALIGLLGALVGPILDVVAGFFQIGEGGSKTINNILDSIIRLRNDGINDLVKGIDGVTASLGGWQKYMQGVSQWVKDTDFVALAAKGVGDAWQSVVPYIDRVKAAMPGIMSSIGSFLSNVPANLSRMGSEIKGLFDKITGFFNKSKGDARNFGEGAKSAVMDFINYFKEALSGLDPMLLLSVLNTAFMAGFVTKIVAMFKSGGTIKDSIMEMLGSITGAFEALQSRLEPDKLKNIGVAILLIAASLAVLASIDPGRLGSAAAGMGIVVASLAALMGVMKLFSLGAGIADLMRIAGGLILLSTAVLILAVAMKQLAGLSWEELAKGLAGLGGSILILALAAMIMGQNSKNMIAGALGMVIMAGALYLMAGAVAIFGAMDMNQLIQGLIGLSVVLAGLAIFVLATGGGQNMLVTGAGLVLIAAGIGLLVGAVAILGALPIPMLVQGLTALAAMLVGLSLATIAMQGSLGGAAAIVAIAVALNLLVIPIVVLGALPWSVVSQGLVAVGIALLILVAATMLITPASAAGLLAMAGAMVLMAAAIAIVGSMPIQAVAVGLLAIAAALAVFGVAALLLAPIIPAMYALAGVMAVVSLALMLGAAAFVVFGIGLAGVGAGAALGAAGILVLGNAVAQLGPHAVTIGVVSLALAALGVAMIAVGAGALVLGAGFLVMGVGLTMVAAAAAPGAIALQALVNTITGMVGQVPALALMTVTLTALSVALLAMGVASLTLAAGGLLLSVALLAVSAVAPMTATAINLLSAAFMNSTGASAGAAAFAAAIGIMVGALFPLAPAIAIAAAALLAFAGSAMGVLAGTAAAAAGLMAMGVAASVASGLMSTAMSAMSAAATSGVSGITAALLMLGPAMMGTSAAVSAGAAAMTAAFVSMGAQAAAAVVGATASIIGALAPLAPAIVAASVAVTVAANLMANAFRTMGSQSVAAINSSGSQIRGALSGIASSSGAAATAVGTAIAQGMVRGLNAGGGSVAAAAQGVAARALSAAKGTLGIHSPSKEFEKIGIYANEGFAKGLRGSNDDIDKAFKEMEDKINDALKSTQDRVNKAQANVNKYAKNPRKYRTALANARKELAAAQATANMARNASASLQSMMHNEQNQLKNLKTEYDEMFDKVKDAEKAYEDAVKERDDAIKSYSDKYNALPSISKESTYETYIKEMQELNEKTQNYHELLESLRKKGLNDKVYRELLDSGLDALPFVEDLVLTGENAVENMNKLADDLGSISGNLGKSAGNNLYQAGVNAAEGFLKGLQARQTEIANAMENIANTVVNRIKSALDIHSPSRVMAKLGENTVKGFVNGLGGSDSEVKKAAEMLGKGFQEDVDREFAKIVSPLNGIFDEDPVVRPTLDLSNIESGAAAIQGILAASMASPNMAVDQARGVSESVRTGQSVEAAIGSTGDTVTYNQYNSSPKALNPGEIYRQTNNQMSKFRKGLE